MCLYVLSLYLPHIVLYHFGVAYIFRIVLAILAGMNTLTPTPESQVGASEHASTSADDKISLDEVIAKFEATADEDVRAREILAAATTLRDSTGRDRQKAIRKMATAWAATLNDKVVDKYKPRLKPTLEKDIQASVCQAALN